MQHSPQDFGSSVRGSFGPWVPVLSPDPVFIVSPPNSGPNSFDVGDEKLVPGCVGEKGSNLAQPTTVCHISLFTHVTDIPSGPLFAG